MNQVKTVLILLCILISASFVQAQEPYNAFISDCWFTALQDTPAYHERELTTLQIPVGGMMEAGQRFQVQEVDGAVALLAIDHAMGFWVEIADGVFFGDCDDVDAHPLQTATLYAESRLWSQPDVLKGDVLLSLPEGARVNILGEGVVGPILYDGSVEDLWYRVQFGATTGWVWVGAVEI